MVVLCHAFREVPTVCVSAAGGYASHYAADSPRLTFSIVLLTSIISRLARRIATGDVKIIESLDYSLNKLKPLSPMWENGLS